MSGRLIYLDANATTPTDDRVWEKMRQVSELAFGNPGSPHQIGRKARQSLEESRTIIAAILGGVPEELIFTSGGTESTNLALQGLAASVPESRRTLALTGAEHPATVESAMRLRQAGWNIVEIAVDEQGLIDREKLNDLPWEKIGLLSIIYAQNETGVIQDLSDIQRLCEQHNVLWHVDFVQAVGRVPVSFYHTEATAASIAVHKCHGPRGIGGLFLKRDVPFVPHSVGGHQEQGRRPGTESVVLAAGMAEALKIWQENETELTSHIHQLRSHFEKSLQLSCAPIVINGAQSPRLPNTSHVSFVDVEAEPLLVALDLEGICCSSGSACKSGSATPSPALLAMGIEPAVAMTSLRFSLHKNQTRKEIDEAVQIISKVVNRLRTMQPR